jgi:hypothetical protein
VVLKPCLKQPKIERSLLKKLMKKIKNNMNKNEVIEMSKKYSKNKQYQDAYKAGFQAACNIVRCKINTCDNGELKNHMI